MISHPQLSGISRSKMKINEINDQQICEFLSLKHNSANPDHIVIESPKVVLKAIETHQKIIKIFCTEIFFEENNEILLPFKDKILTADKILMQKIVGHRLHHGVMALIERPSYCQLSELQESILILNGLTSPENVGTIIRTAASFNIRSIIVDEKTCSPYLRRCIRVSMGNIFYVKVHFTKNLIETINELKNNNVTIYAAANQEKSSLLPKCHFKKYSAIIIGSEGHGIESAVLDLADSILRIEIQDDVAHINAASAASIFLYQLSLSKELNF